MQSGSSILLDIDIKGAQQVRKNASTCTSIFILPPSLMHWNLVSEQEIQTPKKSFKKEWTNPKIQLRGCADFDYLVMNDNWIVHMTVFRVFCSQNWQKKNTAWIGLNILQTYNPLLFPDKITILSQQMPFKQQVFCSEFADHTNLHIYFVRFVFLRHIESWRISCESKRFGRKKFKNILKMQIFE